MSIRNNNRHGQQNRKRPYPNFGQKNVSLPPHRVLRPWSNNNFINHQANTATYDTVHKTGSFDFVSQQQYRGPYFNEVNHTNFQDDAKAFREIAKIKNFNPDQRSDMVGHAVPDSKNKPESKQVSLQNFIGQDHYHHHQLAKQNPSRNFNVDTRSRILFTSDQHVLDLRSRTTRPPGTDQAVDALYKPGSRQCTSCGLRFPPKRQTGDAYELRDHMDWHFKENLKARSENARRWYNLAPWKLDRGHVQTNGQINMVLKDNCRGQNTCALCWEEFKEEYIDEEDKRRSKDISEGWYLLNATATQEGDIIHPTCL